MFVSILSPRQVRVIAIVLRSEEADYRCLMCCQDQLRVSKGVANVHSNHFWFAYGTADITCPLPPGCESTSHITLISPSAMSAGPEDAEQPLTFDLHLITMACLYL